MAHFDRNFGVEFECILPFGMSRNDLAIFLTGQASIVCHSEFYGHITSNTWKVVTDATLGSMGAEVVSPVLRGEDGLTQAMAVAEAITRFGCKINKRCGFHVHVGVQGAPLQFWKNLLSIYGAYEQVFDRMMPNSRRGSTNTYCRSVATIPQAMLARAATFEGLCYLVHSHRDHQRYHKVNLRAYDRHNTAEFRHHSGTTDPLKVRNWILICLKLVDQAFKGTFVPSERSTAVNKARVGSKNWQVGQMLLRPEGVSSREASVFTGWTTTSVPEIARFCGIPFTARKQGRVTYYKAVRVSTDATIDSFAALVGLDQAEKDYMTSRTAFVTRATTAAVLAA